MDDAAVPAGREPAAGPSTGTTIPLASELTAAELADLAGLLVAVVEGASVDFLSPLAPEAAAAHWERTVASDALLLLARCSGRVVGTVQLPPAESATGRHRAEIAKLLVAPDHRRPGLGRRLLTAAEAAAREDGRELLVLDSHEGDPSHALYHALDYRRAGRIPGWSRTAAGRSEATVFSFNQLAGTAPA